MGDDEAEKERKKKEENKKKHEQKKKTSTAESPSDRKIPCLFEVLFKLLAYLPQHLQKSHDISTAGSTLETKI
jgi:hypothetical protein